MKESSPSAEDRAPVVGVVGGVCSGKSTLARMLAEQGFELIDADAIAHDVLKQKEIKEQIREVFGAEVMDGSGEVDRRRLARKAFACSPCMKALNQVTHPPILEEIKRRIRRAARPVVLDAALLMEKRLGRRWCDLVIFVEAPLELREERARAQRGWDPEELSRREEAQMPPRQKKSRAEVVVQNASSREDLRRRARELAERIRQELGIPAREA